VYPDQTQPPNPAEPRGTYEPRTSPPAATLAASRADCDAPSYRAQQPTTATWPVKKQMVLTRNMDKRAGASLVRRAISMGIVPEFKYGTTLKKQTSKTKWALHILAVMSKSEGDYPRYPSVEDVKRVIAETEDLVQVAS